MTSKSAFSVILGILILTGCAMFARSQPATLHSVFKLTACKQAIQRGQLAIGLVKKGFSIKADPKGVYDLFHKPEIMRKSALSQEAYVDKAGDIAVGVCAPQKELQYVLVEEWVNDGLSSCKDKGCTMGNQKEVKALLESWGCAVEERTGTSSRWSLEDRQDWNNETCPSIVEGLEI
jgi:hypothetical protein